MNAGIYKLIWSDNSKAPVVVPETAKSHGKKSAGSAKAAASILTALTIFSLPLTGFGEPVLPTNGVVEGGNAVATITKPGEGVLNINQFQQKAIINWETFSIGNGGVVNFIQKPTDIALNRVTGTEPSQIFGTLRADGQVILINPNGVLFGAGSSVNVGGIVATTMDIRDKDFNNNDGLLWRFFTKDKDAIVSVINDGNITAKEGGYIALMAPEVINGEVGTLTANLGTVALASGDTVALSMQGSELVGIAVKPSMVNALIENKHLIVAENGQVLMSASAYNELQAAAIKGVEESNEQFLLEHGTVRIVNSGDVTTDSMIVKAAGTADHEIVVGGFVQASNSSISSIASLADITYLADNGYGAMSSNIELSELDVVDGNLTVTTTVGDVSIGRLSISRGDLNVRTNGGDIVQVNSANINVATGNVNLDTRDRISDTAKDAGNISLNNPNNIFNGSISMHANDASVSAGTDMALKKVVIGGDLNLNSSGSIYQVEQPDPDSLDIPLIKVAGTTTISSGYDILIDSPYNNFGGSVSLFSSGEKFIDEGKLYYPVISIADAKSILFGDVKTFGNFYAYALSGDIAQDKKTAINVTHNTFIRADNGDVRLNRNANDFNNIGLDVMNGDAVINDRDGIAISALVNGSLAVNSNTNDKKSGPVKFSSVEELFVNDLNSNPIFDNVVNSNNKNQIIGNLTVASNGGDITKTDASTITVWRITTLDARNEDKEVYGDIELANKLEEENVTYGDVLLNGDVSLYGGDISLLNDGDLYLASINSDTAVDAKGKILIGTNASGDVSGDIYVHGAIKTDSKEKNAVTLVADVFESAYRKSVEQLRAVPLSDNDGIYNDVLFADDAKIFTGEKGTWSIYSDNPFTANHGRGTWVFVNAVRRYNVAYETQSSNDKRDKRSTSENYSYYRVQPVLKVGVTPEQAVYGDKTTIRYDGIISEYLIDDVSKDFIGGKLKYTLDGKTSTTGHYTAGSHKALFDDDLGLYSKLGYGFDVESDVFVKINRRELSISDVEAASRYENGKTNATLSDGVLHGVLTEHYHDEDYAGPGDDVGIGAMSGQFESPDSTGSASEAGKNASKRYVASMQVSLQGKDAENYVVTSYDTRALHQSKEGYKGDDTPVINPPVPGQQKPTRLSQQQEIEDNNKLDDIIDSRNSKDGHDYHPRDKENKTREDELKHDKDSKDHHEKKASKNSLDDSNLEDDGDHDKNDAKKPEHGHKHKKHKHNKDHDDDNHDDYVPPGPIEAEIWEQPEPPVLPQYVPTPLEVLDEPRQAPVDLQSTLTESLYDGSGTTSMTGDFTSVQPLGEYNISKGTGIEIEIPASTFQHSDPNAQLEYSAEMQDGSPMPEWLKFDAATRTLKGTPPDGQTGTAIVKIVVRDTNGGEATSTLTINY